MKRVASPIKEFQRRPTSNAHLNPAACRTQPGRPSNRKFVQIETRSGKPLKNRPAIRLNIEPLRHGRPLGISVWQTQFWRKPIVQLPTYSAPKPNPRRHNNMNKNIKILSLGKRLFHSARCGLAFAVFSWSLPALAVNANINIVNFAFSPNTANIGINDTVTWT